MRLEHRCGVSSLPTRALHRILSGIPKFLVRGLRMLWVSPPSPLWGWGAAVGCGSGAVGAQCLAQTVRPNGAVAGGGSHGTPRHGWLWDGGVVVGDACAGMGVRQRLHPGVRE